MADNLRHRGMGHNLRHRGMTCNLRHREMAHHLRHRGMAHHLFYFSFNSKTESPNVRAIQSHTAVCLDVI